MKTYDQMEASEAAAATGSIIFSTVRVGCRCNPVRLLTYIVIGQCGVEVGYRRAGTSGGYGASYDTGYPYLSSYSIPAGGSTSGYDTTLYKYTASPDTTILDSTKGITPSSSYNTYGSHGRYGDMVDPYEQTLASPSQNLYTSDNTTTYRHAPRISSSPSPRPQNTQQVDARGGRFTDVRGDHHTVNIVIKTDGRTRRL
jgi:hypothetical protein